MRYILLAFALVACGEVTKRPDAIEVDADPCTGTCECRVDTDCPGDNTVCDDQTTSRTCECSAGYTRGTSGACEWTGVVRDPGFGAATVWTAGAATIDPNLTDTGILDPGAARFHLDGLCKLARITQDVVMPKEARSQPLVAEITYRYLSQGFIDTTAPAYGLGAAWRERMPASFSTGWTSVRSCLGSGQSAPPAPSGKGAQLPITVLPERVPVNCNDASAFLDVDHFEIKPANPNECPASGTALNGDAEAMGGWVFTGSSANGNPFSAMIEPNVGEANTRGVRLFARNRCSNLAARTAVSVGLLASPALAYFNRTTTGGTALDTDFSLGGVTLPAINASTADQQRKLCVPATMRGDTIDFVAALNLFGACAEIVNASSVTDNVKIVNDPTCGTDPAISDPGFESPNSLIGAFSTPGQSLARTLNDASMAHTGNGVLQLSVMQLCSGATWQANVVVPAASSSGGPALSFFYRAPPPANYNFFVQAGTVSFAPMLDSQWHAGTVCLNPLLSGRTAPVVFGMSGGSGTCANTIPPETAFVDDLQVTTDPSCPAM